MDIVRLASPWVLALAVPAWAIVLYAGLAAGGRRRHGARARAALACLAVGLLLLALAGPSVRVSRQGLCLVCLVDDVSGSMAAAGAPARHADALAPWAAALAGRGLGAGTGGAGLVEFEVLAGRAVAPGSAEGRRLARAADFPADLRPAAAPESPGTRIEQGLLQGAAALPDGQGILLLYTDGRETLGDAAAAAAALAARGIQVHAIAPDLGPRDAAVLSVGPAAEPASGRPVRMEVRVASTVPAEVRVTLDRPAAGAAPAGRWERRVALDPGGPAALVFDDEAPLPDGRYRYTARVAFEGDGCPENDAAACDLAVGRGLRLVYVHGGAAPGAVFDVLRRHVPAGCEVTAVAAGARPLSGAAGAAAGGASVIILDDVAAWALGQDTAREVARQVTDGGAGLLALGGEASFAAGGYADSPFEDLLPLSSRTGERPPVAMVVVLDSSGSMNERAGEVTKIALAKQAVLALRPALGAADRLGIVAFAGEPRVVSPLAALDAWDALRAQLLAIQAGGGTRITPAVEAAAGLFGPAAAGDRTVRHVLLLSDGRSADFDAPRLAAACRAGRISVSAVATGPDADRPRLAGLAEATGGRLHDTGDLGRLAETFLKDLAWARGEGLRSTPREAAWRAPSPVWPAAGPPLPAVPGYNATRSKDGADVHWATVPRAGGEEAAPLLATWRRGLGKVAAMPWPVGRGAEAWLSDEAAGRYLAPVVAWLSAATVPTDWSARLAERGGRWWVRAEERAGAVGRSADAFVASAPATEGDRAAAVDLVQTAPGVHEGRLPAAASGGEVVVHRRGAPQEAVHLAMPGAPPLEFRRLGVDRPALEAIVRAGGGKVHASPESLAEAVRQVQVRGFEPAGVLLLWAAAAVAAVQAALRLLGRL